MVNNMSIPQEIRDYLAEHSECFVMVPKKEGEGETLLTHRPSLHYGTHRIQAGFRRNTGGISAYNPSKRVWALVEKAETGPEFTTRQLLKQLDPVHTKHTTQGGPMRRKADMIRRLALEVWQESWSYDSFKKALGPHASSASRLNREFGKVYGQKHTEPTSSSGDDWDSFWD